MDIFEDRSNISFLGTLDINKVHHGDCLNLLRYIPDNSIDIIVTSPPYWGQRTSLGVGVEDDPRQYLDDQIKRFVAMKRVLKDDGILWINIGDAYNTPINWTSESRKYSTLGSKKTGLNENNSAYTKPRHKRKAYIDNKSGWLKYGNLLALPQRLIIGLCDEGYLFRSEVIWNKSNPMPEGLCRRPHRSHEPIYLFSKTDKHSFRTKPPVKTVWTIANEGNRGIKHMSRFPIDIPIKCIESFGKSGKEVVVLDPYSGSGTTCLAAISLGCSYIGFDIDPIMVEESNKLLNDR